MQGEVDYSEKLVFSDDDDQSDKEKKYVVVTDKPIQLGGAASRVPSALSIPVRLNNLYRMESVRSLAQITISESNPAAHG